MSAEHSTEPSRAEAPLNSELTEKYMLRVADGLVLKLVRNGDMIQEASTVTPLKKTQELLPASWGEKMDAADYHVAVAHHLQHQSVGHTDIGLRCSAERNIIGVPYFYGV